MMNRSAVLFLLLPVFGLVYSQAAAQKTDTVTFYNGDRAVCEIQALSQGKLSLRTVAMGTISVEWRKVSDIASNKTFEIVLKNHSTIYGRILGIDSARNVTLAFGIFTEVVPMKEIISLHTIKESWWARLDGKLSIGFSYAQGTENIQLNSSGFVNYRKKRLVHNLSFNYNASANPNTESLKQDGGYRLEYYHRHRVYNALELRWERNTELGLDSRLITMLSVGYNPVQSSFNIFSTEIGVSANREFTIADSVTNNVEGLIRLNYDFFMFSSPKLFIHATSSTFPSFTVKGRVRSNFEIQLSWEIFRDFTFSIAYWANYDSRPTDENALNYDWGTTTGIDFRF